MKKLNLKNIKTNYIKEFLENIMKKHNIEQLKILILVGNRVPEIRLEKQISDEKGYWWKVIESFYASTSDKNEYMMLGDLWKEFFDNVSRYDDYDESNYIIVKK